MISGIIPLDKQGRDHGRWSGREENRRFFGFFSFMFQHAGRSSIAIFSVAFDWVEVKIMSFKIAIIGAGSVGFTKKLFTDILCVPEFRDVEFALTDLSEHNLEMIKAILDRIVEANGLPTKVT